MMYHCRNFKGDEPCEWSKSETLVCNESCRHYTPTDGRTLIIKLGALGDVVRTTPILHELWKMFPHRQVWWLTKYPEVIPDAVDVVLPFNLESVLTVRGMEFDRIYNLDKDKCACGLAKRVNALYRYGYTLHQGYPMGLNPAAERSIHKGIDDEYSKNLILSYQEEIFQICEFGKFDPKEHECILPYFKRILRPIDVQNPTKPVIGLYTSFGDRWMARRWSVGSWIELCSLLKKDGYQVLLLGDKGTDAFNKFLQKETGVLYAGTRYPIMSFVQQLLDACDIVVSVVTGVMHLALGMKKKVVVLNNIFNSKELELYGRGIILEPERPCRCYYGEKCMNSSYRCMDYLYPNQVLNAIYKLEAVDEQSKQ